MTTKLLKYIAYSAHERATARVFETAAGMIYLHKGILRRRGPRIGA